MQREQVKYREEEGGRKTGAEQEVRSHTSVHVLYATASCALL